MMNYFDLLPPETIEFIFKKLYLNDLINLRIVNKRFKKICDQIKIKKLCISNTFNYSYSIIWFYTNDPTYFNKENVIKFSKFSNYSKIFQFKHLKRLGLDIDDFNFSILNQFKLLEQLDVTTNKLIDNYKLSLDHLKIVDFELKDDSDFKLTFDTIKLFAFRFGDWNSIDNVVFNYPDKILFFEIDYIGLDWQLFYDNQLRNLNNLQYLRINNLHFGSIGRNMLTQHEKLKILDLSMDLSDCHDDFHNLVDDFHDLVEHYYNLVEDIKFLIKEKEKLRRSEFEIYFESVKLISQNKIDEIQRPTDFAEFDYNLLEFQFKNYDLLKDNCDNYEINYCDLIKIVKIIPSTFTNKFPFIYYVKANDHIGNENQFFKFLNNLSYLSELELINCELTQSFYDQLIDFDFLNNNLMYLKIKEKKDLKLNFDFILNLKQLEYFETNQIIANHIELIYELFKQNENIEEFQFKCDSKNYIKIRSYYLDDPQQINNFSIDNLEDFDDLIPKLKELKF